MKIKKFVKENDSHHDYCVMLLSEIYNKYYYNNFSLTELYKNIERPDIEVPNGSILSDVCSRQEKFFIQCINLLFQSNYIFKSYDCRNKFSLEDQIHRRIYKLDRRIKWKDIMGHKITVMLKKLLV